MVQEKAVMCQLDNYWGEGYNGETFGVTNLMWKGMVVDDEKGWKPDYHGM
jgi:hypothetical protein